MAPRVTLPADGNYTDEERRAIVLFHEIGHGVVKLSDEPNRDPDSRRMQKRDGGNVQLWENSIRFRLNLLRARENQPKDVIARTEYEGSVFNTKGPATTEEDKIRTWLDDMVTTLAKREPNKSIPLQIRQYRALMMIQSNFVLRAGEELSPADKIVRDWIWDNLNRFE